MSKQASSALIGLAACVAALQLSAQPATIYPATIYPSTIYRCEVAGVQTFSDRPCGETTQVHVPTDFVTNRYQPTPPAARPRAEKPPSPKKSSGSTDRSATTKRATCDRIERSLDDIRSKMRSGYGAAEGERLKERQKQLRDQRRQERCS